MLLLVWADIANHLCTGQICGNRGIGRKVVEDTLRNLGEAALGQERKFGHSFSRIQVDETFIGKRK